MNDELSTSTSSTQRSWLEKLGQALGGEPRDRHELLEILRDATERQLLDPRSLDMIEAVLEVPQLRVRDIMIPRSQMVVIEEDMSLKSILPIVMTTVHSRFPVIGDNKDEVLGILLAKDLLSHAFDENKPFKIKEILRPAVFVPESKRLDVLLQEFRLNRNHMAVVVDEYGGVTGLITIEDVLEQIVGDIEDEYDTDDAQYIRKYNENSFAVRALTPIEDFNEYFATKALEDKEADTIGGLVLREFGHLPKRGESIEISKFRFKVLRADNRRIYLLQVTLLPAKNA